MMEGKAMPEIEVPLAQVEKTEEGSEKKQQSINYGYHPIIDFFGNFRFDSA